MLELIVLGKIPGTETYISVEAVGALLVLLGMLCLYRIRRAAVRSSLKSSGA